MHDFQLKMHHKARPAVGALPGSLAEFRGQVPEGKGREGGGRKTKDFWFNCYCSDAAAGGTDDYVKAVSGVKYAFVAELRGSDFVISKRQIQPSFDEMWSGIVAMCDTIAAKEG